jgi:predicted nucleic acid-binding protein
VKSFLPDVNALLALLDPMHVHHDSAHQWYQRNFPLRLWICPHVENGVIRVASQPKYPNCMGTSKRVRELVQAFVRKVNARHCLPDVSLLNDRVLIDPGLLTPSRVSDLYLLALASANGVCLATFDRRIPAEAVAGGLDALELIPVSSGKAGM